MYFELYNVDLIFKFNVLYNNYKKVLKAFFKL